MHSGALWRQPGERVFQSCLTDRAETKRYVDIESFTTSIYGNCSGKGIPNVSRKHSCGYTKGVCLCGPGAMQKDTFHPPSSNLSNKKGAYVKRGFKERKTAGYAIMAPVVIFENGK